MALTETVLDELRHRQAVILAESGRDKVQARRDQGRMTARDRLASLFEDGTLQEIGMHVRGQRQANVAQRILAMAR